jgi:folate-binding Fe-S cluster repair protein YgfZ
MSSSVELRTLAAGAFAYVLPERIRIAIGGPDALSWLGGVLTCEVGSSATYGCALNAAGKILSDSGDPHHDDAAS